jgi:hypothetical protein
VRHVHRAKRDRTAAQHSALAQYHNSQSVLQPYSFADATSAKGRPTAANHARLIRSSLSRADIAYS